MSLGDVVIDDHLLLRVLVDDEPADLRAHGGRISTMALWHHRLGRALSTPAATGSLSRALGDAEPGLGVKATRAVGALPEAIGLTSLRELASPMVQLLEQGERPNLLSLEALATAEHRGAEICLAAADENPPLLDAAARRGVRTRLIDA